MKPAPPVMKMRFPCRGHGGHSSLAECRETSTPGSMQLPARTRSSSIASGALVLRRPPEADGRERALAKLREGTLSRAGLLQELVGSDEFRGVVLLDAGLARAAAERGARRAPARAAGARRE